MKPIEVLVGLSGLIRRLPFCFIIGKPYGRERWSKN